MPLLSCIRVAHYVAYWETKQSLNVASDEQKPKCSYENNCIIRPINLFLRLGGSGTPWQCGRWSNEPKRRPKPLGDAPVNELIPSLWVHTGSLLPPWEFPAPFWGRSSVSTNNTLGQKNPKQQCVLQNHFWTALLNVSGKSTERMI